MNQESQLSTNHKDIDFFLKHIVPLVVTYSKENKKYTGVYTAFILSVRGRWFFITAGHCLQEIQSLKDCGYSIEKAVLLDGLRSSSFHNEPIPFAIDKISRFNLGGFKFLVQQDH
jgi:hypothetical protein